MLRNMMTLFKILTKKTQALTFGTVTPVPSIGLDANAIAVRITSTADCWVEFEGTVEAVGTINGAVTSGLSMFLAAGVVEVFPIDIAGSTGAVVTVLGVTGGGIAYITPMTE